MLRGFLKTDSNSYEALIARLALGIVILPHGLQKLLGMFGGAGFSGTMDFFVSQGLPAFVAALIIIGESFGALGLIFGFLSRLSAFGVTLIMLGAVFMVHLPNGFFMNWQGNQAGEGFEYHLLAIGLGLIVLVAGGGMFSVDGVIAGE